MLLHLGYLLREALHGLKLRKGAVILSSMTIGLSLLIFGVFLLATINMRRVIQDLREKVEIEIYLEDSVTAGEADTLVKRIEDLEGVLKAMYVSKDDALREADLDTAFLSTVGKNPLPASIRVRMKEGYQSAAGVASVVNSIGGVPGVEEIASGKEWTGRLDRFVLILSLTTVVVGIIFGLASALVISSAVQLTIFSRRETIDIMQLIGAKDSLIKASLLIEGIIQGVMGGMIAAGGLCALHWTVQHRLTELLPLGPKILLVLVVGGGLLGGLGGNLSVGRFLRTQAIP